jgi:hypothetical protein
VLQRVLANETSARSATTELRELNDPARRLREAAAQYVDAVTLAPCEAGGTAPPPLPWLPDRPRPADPRWARYLDERASLVATLVEQVRHDAMEAADAARPGSALSRHDPELVGAREVFRAVHGRTTSADELDESARHYLQTLEQRMERHEQATLQSLEAPPRTTPPAPRAFSPALDPTLGRQPARHQAPSL